MLSMGIKAVARRTNDVVCKRTCKLTHEVFGILVAMLDGGGGTAAIALHSAASQLPKTVLWTGNRDTDSCQRRGSIRAHTAIPRS